MPKDASGAVGQDNGAYSQGAQTTALTVSNGGWFLARLGNQEIGFRSEADYLKVNAYIQQMQQTNSQVPVLGGSAPQLMGNGNGAGNWLQRAATGVQGIGSYFQSRNLRQRLRDIQDAHDEAELARRELNGLQTKYPDLVPAIAHSLDANMRVLETQEMLIEDEIGWVDLQTGANVANFFSNYVNSQNGVGSFLSGNGFAAGAVGLGVGFLLSRNDSNDRRRR